MVAPKAGIHQAFAMADVMISQSVRSIVNLIQRPGLIRIGFDDLLSALRSPERALPVWFWRKRFGQPRA